MNKIIDNNLQNRHNNFVAKKEIYNSIQNFLDTKKADKLRKKNQEIIANTLTKSTFKSKEEEYINALMTGNNLTGALLYDWDQKDGDPTHNGGYKFAAIKNAEAYKEYVSKYELELFSEHKNQIANTILFAQPQRIIDMGGGDGTKTTKILDILPTGSLANVTLTSKDISGYLLDEYTSNLQNRSKSHNNSIKTAARYENFLQAGELISNTDKRLFLFKGGTIGQFDDNTVEKILKNMFSEKLFATRHSIVTMFLSPEKNSADYSAKIQKLLAAYGSGDTSNPFYDNNTHLLIKDWIMSGIEYWLGDQVKGKLEFNVNYREDGEKGGAIVLGAKVLESFTIKIGNQVYSKQAGDMIYAIQSRRFSKNHFASLAQKGGHSIDTFLQNEGVGIAIMHTNKYSIKSLNPIRLAEFKRKIKLFLGGAIVLGSIWSGVKINEFSQKNAQEKRWKQDVKNELGYTNNYYGPTESSLENSWNEIYKKYLSNVFGISNPDKLKYDFLARYIEAYKRGEIRYGSRLGGYDKTIEVFEKYIVGNKLRIKFDKGIEFVAHKELVPKEEILLETYNIGNIEVVASNATEYKTYKLKDGELYYEFDYFFKEVNGKTLIFARPHMVDNKNYVFSTDYAQQIINDYFTPLLSGKISGDFYGIIKDDAQGINRYRSIKNRLMQLNMEGYNFDYSLFIHDNYNIKAKYFMQTFMPQYELKDPENQNYNLQQSIETLVHEILLWNPKISSQKEINALRGNIFSLLLKKSNSSTDKKHLKEWLVYNYNELGLNDNSFVFQYKPYESELMSTLGLINKEHNDVLPSSNSGVPFYSMGEYTTKKGEKFEIGIIKKISGNTMAARYIGGNKDFISQAKDSIENKYLSYQYGWRPEDLATIQEGKNSDKLPNAESLIHVRNMKRFEVQKMLDVPNTYFANIVYEDWLSK